MLLGLLGGATLGLCVAPVWLMLQLPIRAADTLGASGRMRLYAAALALGSTVGALCPQGTLPDAAGAGAMLLCGAFVVYEAQGILRREGDDIGLAQIGTKP